MEPYVCEINTAGQKFSAAEVQAFLKEIKGSTTVPALFIKGKCYGGCTDLKELEFQGKINAILGPFMTGKPQKGSRITMTGLFYFSEVANAYVARVVAFFSSCLRSYVSISTIINRHLMPW